MTVMTRKPPRLTVPTRLNPLVRALFLEMREQQASQEMVAERAGVNKNTLKDWRTRTIPRITDLQACLNGPGLSDNCRGSHALLTPQAFQGGSRVAGATRPLNTNHLHGGSPERGPSHPPKATRAGVYLPGGEL